MQCVLLQNFLVYFKCFNKIPKYGSIRIQSTNYSKYLYSPKALRAWFVTYFLMTEFIIKLYYMCVTSSRKRGVQSGAFRFQTFDLFS